MNIVDANLQQKRGCSARLCQRILYEKTFMGDIRDPHHNYFHTTLTPEEMSDDEILCTIEKNAPACLVPKLLEIFARSRWNGGQDQFEAILLLCGTHDMLGMCLNDWLDVKQPAAVRPTRAALVADDIGYSSEEDVAHDQQNLPHLAECIAPTTANVDQASGEFHTRMRGDTIRFVQSKPRAKLTIIATVNRALDVCLKRKLYISGERWEKSNDVATVATGQRKYRILEACSNAPEFHVATAAQQLLHDPGGMGGALF